MLVQCETLIGCPDVEVPIVQPQASATSKRAKKRCRSTRKASGRNASDMLWFQIVQPDMQRIQALLFDMQNVEF